MPVRWCVGCATCRAADSPVRVAPRFGVGAVPPILWVPREFLMAGCAGGVGVACQLFPQVPFTHRQASQAPNLHSTQIVTFAYG